MSQIQAKQIVSNTRNSHVCKCVGSLIASNNCIVLLETGYDLSFTNSVCLEDSYEADANCLELNLYNIDKYFSVQEATKKESPPSESNLSLCGYYDLVVGSQMNYDYFI